MPGKHTAMWRTPHRVPVVIIQRTPVCLGWNEEGLSSPGKPGRRHKHVYTFQSSGIEGGLLLDGLGLGPGALRSALLARGKLESSFAAFAQGVPPQDP